MKRYGRTVVTSGAARSYSYAARIVGADHHDVSGNCTAPVAIALTGIPSLRLDRMKQWSSGEMDYAVIDGRGYHEGTFQDPKPRHVDLMARCRKCEACLKARAFHWTERAAVECARSTRTWFCTLTLTPEQQSRCIMLARAYLARREVEFVDGSDIAFKAQVKPVVKELQLFMKRLRKKASGLRYLATIEKHASGLPHVHVLIHETGEPITNRVLSASWNWGFSKFKLVPPDDQRKHARYVCKYLTKSLITRIVASRQYGANPPCG